MRKNIQWVLLPLLTIMVACTINQVSETTSPIKQNLFSDNLKIPSEAGLINSEKSLLTVHVNKAGLLSFIGHQHIVASRDLDGWVDEVKNQGYFSFDIAKMTMDEPALLKSKMLPDELNVSEKEATKQNMMKMLDANNFPNVRVLVTSYDIKKSMIHAKIIVKDQMIERDLLVKVTKSASNKITNLTGETSLKLLDFAVEPFSALGGLLSVNDEIVIEWKLAFK